MRGTQEIWLLVALQMLLFALIWFAAARMKRDARTALGAVGAFNLLSGLAAMAIALRGVLPDALTRAGADLALLLAFTVMQVGGATLIEAKRRPSEPWLMFFVPAAGVILASLAGAQNVRVAVHLLGIAAMVARACRLAFPILHRHGAGFALGVRAVTLTIVGFLVLYALVGLALGWPLEVEHGEVLAYVMLLGLSLINGVLAYAVLRSTLTQLRHLTHHDALTGLLNRRAIMEQLEHAWARRDDTPFGLIVIDIDHFKAINDTYGHGVGDLALTRVATALRGELRATDRLARHGGEEFVVLARDAAHTQAIAERLRAAVETMDRQGLPDHPITVSAGVAASSRGDARYDDVLNRADRALYEAKASGRNRVVRGRSGLTDPPSLAA